MAVYFLNEDWKKLEEDVLDIFAKTAAEETGEALVADVRDCLMGKGLHCPASKRRWKGLTSRDIMFAPVGAKYKSDLKTVGRFEDVMEHFGYSVRHEKHGAGIKYLAFLK